LATATAVKLSPHVDAGRPWFLGLFWLAVLGPFFFLSYGFANTVTSHRAYVPSLAFGWETSVPFLAWTIVPYWTSDLLYAVSMLVCTTRQELTMHVKRLLAAQVISVGCFLAFPLRCIFERPETHGFFGWLFDVLLGFDKPFNQAPSLHVSLAVILWSRFSAHLTGAWRTAMRGWLVLVVLSTMTTYQHQFLDLPAGALAGLLTIALFPDGALVGQAQRMRLATFYLSGSVLATAIACKVQGPAWILLWLAAALLVVAIAYFANRPLWLRYPAIRLIAAPYTAGAWINSRWWTRSHPEPQEIVDGVWLGRAPGRRPEEFRSIVNLAAELHLDATRNVPMLDLVEPTTQQLRVAVDAIEELGTQRPTLVCCALGYSRSASAVAAWLVATGRAASTRDAAAMIREIRPRVVLSEVSIAPGV
jgi:protein-tyrosine phosphatase